MSRAYTFELPHGHRWNAADVHLLWVYRGSTPHPRVLVRGPLSSVSVLEGSLEVTSREICTRAESGDTWLFTPSARALRFSREHTYISVGCSASWPDSTELLPMDQPLLLKGKESQVIIDLANQLLNTIHGKDFSGTWYSTLYYSPQSLSQHARIQALIWEWFSHVSSLFEAQHANRGPKPPIDSRVATLIRRLNEGELERGFHSKDFGDEMSLSWRRMEQLFKEEIGITPNEYFERRRVTATLKWLTTGEASIKEIAARLGFQHSTHFSRWFSRQFGTSPVKFRKQQTNPPVE